MAIAFFVCACGFVGEAILIQTNHTVVDQFSTRAVVTAHAILLSLQSGLISFLMCVHRMNVNKRHRIALLGNAH